MSLLFGIVLFAPLSSAQEIYSVYTAPPGSRNDGPTGSIMQILGSNILPRTDAKHLVMAFTSADIPVSPLPFVMELEVISWSDAMIVARIPGFDTASFRDVPYGAPYDMTGRLPEETVAYFDGHSVPGLVKILVEEDRVISNYGNSRQFTITPSTDMPAINRLSASARHAGDGLWIFGSNFGTEAGEVIFKDSSGADTVITPSGWSTTDTTIRIPDAMRAGTYSIFVRRINREGTATNDSEPKAINIEPSEATSMTIASPSPSTLIFIPPELPVCAAVESLPEEPAPAPGILSGIADKLCPFFSRIEITNAYPHRGPPGTFVELTGKCLGSTQGDYFIAISGEGIAGDRIKADVIRWSGNKVIIRVPGPEMIETLPTGEETILTESDGSPRLYYDAGGASLPVKLELRKGVGVLGKADFTITPYPSAASPILCRTAPKQVVKGSCFEIFGGGFNEESSDKFVFFESEELGTVSAHVDLWSSTMITACTHDIMGVGAYKVLFTKKSAGESEWRVSNKLDINVLERLTTMPMEMQIKSRPPRVEVAPTAPQEMQMQTKPPRLEIKPYYAPVQPMGVGDGSKKKNGDSSTIKNK